jgi:hypothetical protein
MAGAPGQPMAVTPIAVGNLSAATPVQTQGYPDYSPEYYPGYDSPEYYPGYELAARQAEATLMRGFTTCATLVV